MNAGVSFRFQVRALPIGKNAQGVVTACDAIMPNLIGRLPKRLGALALLLGR